MTGFSARDWFAAILYALFLLGFAVLIVISLAMVAAIGDLL